MLRRGVTSKSLYQPARRVVPASNRRFLLGSASGLSPAFRPLAGTSFRSLYTDITPTNMANTTGSTSETYGNFDLVRKIKLDFTDVTVSKWRSRVTGLSVVHLDYQAPIVNGYFVVGTEIFNDTGCPHTLEHLVFMGSEKYPYKGIIDQLANRGFSNGTNAWTDTDHTAYTISTAGPQGFLKMLPIYVDHILYPTMTNAGFVTEVHHIDPKGHDSGVVYSEMQGRENTSGDLMQLRMQQLLYPPGSAYRSETGGLMEALRVLTVDQIRDYHSKYYVPHNLSLIIAGQLSPSLGSTPLLTVLQNEIEPSLISHSQNRGPHPPGWVRPFIQSPTAALQEPIKEVLRQEVEFPEKDESLGELVMAWKGPDISDVLERKALDILGTYLTSSATAPLMKEFVEIENPLCTYIYFSEETRVKYVELPIYIGSVPISNLHTFDSQLLSSLSQISASDGSGIDMSRMKMILDRDERQLRSKLESSKGDVFSGTVISDFLYGHEDGTDLGKACDEMSMYETLKGWGASEWASLLRRWYVDSKYNLVIGKPSSSLISKLSSDEEARIQEQVKKLGPDGLKRAEQELEEAKKEHERPIPKEVLTSFPVPDVKSIEWIKVMSCQQQGKGRSSGGVKRREDVEHQVLETHIANDGEPLDFFVQYDHVKSDFVTVHAYLSLENVPDELRAYISTYLSSFFSLPVRRHSTGETLSHTDVLNALDSSTVAYDVSLGTASSSFSELLHLAIKVPSTPESYELAISWLRDLIYGSDFSSPESKERLGVTVAKIAQSLPEMKRDGNTVLGSVWSDVIYDERSTSRASGLLEQMEFIPKIAKLIQEQPEEVVKSLETIRKCITEPRGVRFSVTGNVLSIPKPRSTFTQYFKDLLPASDLTPVPFSVKTLSEIAKNPSKKAIVMSLPTIESSYATHTARGLQGFTHPDYPAVRVALEVLNATESYLWKYIRGSGLAYGAYVSLDVEAGLLSFTLYRSSNSIGAFEQAATVVKGLVDGTIEIEDTTIDAAKSSIVYGVAKNVSTEGRAAMDSFNNQALKSVAQNYQVQLLSKYASVSHSDIVSVLKTYFLPLFDAKSSIAVVVTAPTKTDSTATSLGEKGFEVERRELEVDEDEMSGSEDEDGSDSDSDESMR